MRGLAVLLSGLTCLAAWSGGAAAVEVSIEEWPVPWPDSRPRDPAVAADGRIWFVGQGGDYLAVMDPGGEGGEPAFRRYELPEGTGPHNVVAGPEGDLWVAGNRNHRIIRVSPESGETTEYDVGRNDADPHTQRFTPDGTLWFTLQYYNAIGRLKPDDGDIRLIRLPMGRVRPYGLDATADGDLWFAEFGSNRLAQLRSGKLEIREYPLPRWDARPRRLAVAADGGVWYVDYAGGYLGRLDPLRVHFEEWRAPAGGDALPYGMALDGEGRPWFVQTGPDPNTLVGFDPKTRRFIAEVAIPSGAGAVRNMVWDAKRSSFWFGTDANTIVRAHIP
jgi:virginiamycin B lyase